VPPLRCPRCGMVVQVPAGMAPACPRCGFGAAAVAAPPAPSAFDPIQADLANRARQARTWGILAIVSPFLAVFPLLGSLFALGGIAFGIVAIVMGSGAKRGLAPYGPSPALSMARTAVVLGIVGLCLVPLLVVLAAVVFVLVTKLSAGTAGALLAGP